MRSRDIHANNAEDPCRRCGHSRANHGSVSPESYKPLRAFDTSGAADDASYQIEAGTCFCGCPGFAR